MATVGQSLTAPETGWKRIDDTDVNIQYINGERREGYYEYNTTYTQGINMECRFSFTGTKLRIIGFVSTVQYATIAYVIIDSGAPVAITQRGSVGVAQALNFDIQNLSDGMHSCKIYCDNGDFLLIDAIDIDAAGTLEPYNVNPTPVLSVPTNLIATAGDAKVNLSWTAVTGATGYNVKRSTTPGGLYTIVGANVTGTSYSDTSVTNGATYYYVVTAVSGTAESVNSNEASATPQAPSGHGLLRITMNDSSEREYQLSDDEISKFIEWCDRTVGTGKTLYVFNKTYNVGEFKSRKEYLLFEKIISFEVMELTK